MANTPAGKPNPNNPLQYLDGNFVWERELSGVWKKRARTTDDDVWSEWVERDDAFRDLLIAVRDKNAEGIKLALAGARQMLEQKAYWSGNPNFNSKDVFKSSEWNYIKSSYPYASQYENL